MKERKDDGTFGEVIDALHERVGICGHCGKRTCPDRHAMSTLPKSIKMADLIGMLEKFFGVGR